MDNHRNRRQNRPNGYRRPNNHRNATESANEEIAGPSGTANRHGNGHNADHNGQKRKNNQRNGPENANNENADPNGGNRNLRNKKSLVATNPIGFKTLENALTEVKNDAELILKLSSKMNGFLILLDQRSIRPDMMCLILAALARASKSSTEQDSVQLLAHFYMEIIPKLAQESNFYRELKLYIAGNSYISERFSLIGKVD